MIARSVRRCESCHQEIDPPPRVACGECSICYAAKLVGLEPRADICVIASPL